MQQTSPGSQTWRTLLRIPAGSLPSRAITAQVIRQGPSVIYIPVYGDQAAGAGTQHTVIFSSTDSGASWQPLADPCGGTGQHEHDAARLAAAAGGFLTALCAPRTGSGPTFVLTSRDYGSSWSPPRTVPGATGHYLDLIAVASPTLPVVATGGAGGSGAFTYRLAVSASGGRRWSTAITGTTYLNTQVPSATFLGFQGTPESAGGSATATTSGPPATAACTGPRRRSPERSSLVRE